MQFVVRVSGITKKPKRKNNVLRILALASPIPTQVFSDHQSEAFYRENFSMLYDITLVTLYWCVIVIIKETVLS